MIQQATEYINKNTNAKCLMGSSSTHRINSSKHYT